MPIESGGEMFYDVEELAGRLGIDEKTIRELIKEKKLRAENVEGTMCVSQRALRAFFEGDHGTAFCRRKKERDTP